MPPLCVRCGRTSPQYGGYCRRCLPHRIFLEAIKRAYDPDQVRVDHVLYEIRPEVPPDPRFPREATGGRGFGGQEFTIRFHNGRTIKTRNLWWLGDIPEEYWEALPDNAVFVKKGGARLSRAARP